ncbi:DUF6448 family protein [uncultured Ilyobacter sp.]|uniref:DUF6448 family protein n=1 Tax=uncultured Ilyobacter sp. TaxID=544433 RepID=UPI0029C75465|nr:DUF6448 family protein [uncultured Ilyobacter sp.]
MKKKSIIFLGLGVFTVLAITNKNQIFLIPFLAPLILAHCDTMDGPLVMDIKKSLKSKNIIPVLKWIKENDEEEIKNMFKKVLFFSKENSELKELLELYFIETVVRVHRNGEDAPYNGLKPSGFPIDPIIEKGDLSIENGEIDSLSEFLTKEIKIIIENKFKKALELKDKADIDVEIGRQYTEAYADYIHFIESLHQLIEGAHHTHDEKHKH